MKKRLLFLLLACTFPIWVSLNVWQSYRFERLKIEISGLEKDQRELLQESRKLLTNIETLSSPGRIENIAAHELGLERTDPSRVTKIIVSGSGGRGGL